MTIGPKCCVNCWQIIHLSNTTQTHYLFGKYDFSAVPALSGCKAGFLTSTYCRTNSLFENIARSLPVWVVVISAKHHYDVRFNITCFCKGSLFVLFCIYKCLCCVLASVFVIILRDEDEDRNRSLAL